MTKISEVAPDVFRISTFLPDFNLQFNQFVVRDEEPLLFHTGLRALFPAVRDAVATVLERPGDLSERGRRRARELYTWDAVAARLEHVYRAALAA